MADKKQYYGLDEIGFIGTQKKRSAAQVKKDIDKTVQYIKAKKNVKVISSSKKKSSRISKAK